MSKWSKSLPKPTKQKPWSDNRINSALALVNLAIMDSASPYSTAPALRAVRLAGAEVRAERKRLGFDLKLYGWGAMRREYIQDYLTEAAADLKLVEEDGVDGSATVDMRLKMAETNLRRVARALEEWMDERGIAA